MFAVGVVVAVGGVGGGGDVVCFVGVVKAVEFVIVVVACVIVAVFVVVGVWGLLPEGRGDCGWVVGAVMIVGDVDVVDVGIVVA